MFPVDLSLGKLHQIEDLHCILALAKFTVYISRFKGSKSLRNKFCSIQYFPSLFDHKMSSFPVIPKYTLENIDVSEK